MTSGEVRPAAAHLAAHLDQGCSFGWCSWVIWRLVKDASLRIRMPIVSADGRSFGEECRRARALSGVRFEKAGTGPERSSSTLDELQGVSADGG